MPTSQGALTAMHCFYIEPPVDGLAALPPEEAKHAAKVLRLRPGDAVCAMDGAGGRWDAEVASVSGNAAALRLLNALPDNEAPVRVTLYQGMPKADKLEFIAQKLTELGAAALAPVVTARSVSRPDGRERAKRRERLDRIAREAAKQCRRGWPVRVEAPLDWGAALDRMQAHDLLLTPWEEAGGRRVRDVWRECPEARDIGIVVGPEGGIEPAEIAALEAVGAQTVTLGPRILRAETAAVAAVAEAMALWGDL